MCREGKSPRKKKFSTLHTTSFCNDDRTAILVTFTVFGNGLGNVELHFFYGLLRSLCE